MIPWIKRIVEAIAEDAEPEWELEPHLSGNVETLLEIARNDGDWLGEARIIRHTLTFPTFELATGFRDSVPHKWKTNVSKRDDGEAWQCECDQHSVPDSEKLIAETRQLWSLALAVHPVLWAYTGMYDATGELMWYVAPPLLEFENE